MSASAASPSRAEILAAKKKSLELQAQHRALEEQMAALSVGNSSLTSTLERSLGRDLESVRDADALESVRDAMNHLDDIDYGEEDLLDMNFWEHGVQDPAELPKDLNFRKLKEGHAGLLFRRVAEWESAYRLLEAKFIKRALVAHDLRLAYAKKRQALKDALAGEAKSSAAVVSTKAAARVAVAKAKAAKPCGCSKGCNSGCGCRKTGFGCSLSCGCGTVCCLNPLTYDDDDAGQALLAAAQADKARVARELAAAKMAAAEAMARRAESGFD